ncbi:MAG: hypothetical protein AAGA56_02665 [Myxococcota bacterium]
MVEARFSSEAIWRRRTWRAYAALAVSLAGLPLFATLPLAIENLGLLAVYVVTVSSAFRRTQQHNEHYRPRVLDTVEVADGVLFLDGTPYLLSSFSRAAIDSSSERPVVRLQRRGGGASIDLEMADEAAAIALTEAMGLGASQRRSRFDAQRFNPSIVGIVGIFLYCASVIVSALGGAAFIVSGLGATAFVALSVFALLHFTMRSAITVGSDGMEVPVGWGRRFIAFRELDRVRLEEARTAARDRRKATLVLTIHGEERPVPIALFEEPADLAQARALLGQIERARDQSQGHDQGASLGRELATAPRSTWIDRLESRREVNRLRAAAIDDEALWHTLDNPMAAPLDRAAAAVALRPGMGADAEERFRALAASTTAPQLRVVLERIASGGESLMGDARTDVEAALEALAEESSRVEEEAEELPPYGRGTMRVPFEHE